MSITVGTGRTCGGIVILVVADDYGFARGCAKPLDRVLPLQVRSRASDPADDQEFDSHDHNGNGRSSSKFWNQIWQGVTDSSCRSHQSADKTTKQRFAAASQTAVIRSCLSERH